MSILRAHPPKPFWFFITINILPLIFHPKYLQFINFASGFNSYNNNQYRRIDINDKENGCNVTKTNNEHHDFRNYANNIFEGLLQSVGCFWTEKIAGSAAEHVSSHGVNKFATKNISRESVKKIVGNTAVGRSAAEKLTWKSGKRAVEETGSRVIQSSVYNPGKHMVENNAGKIAGKIFKQKEQILLQKKGKELARKAAAKGGTTTKILEHTGEQYLGRKSIRKMFLSKSECLFNKMPPITKTNKPALSSLMSQTNKEICHSAKKLRFGQRGRGGKEGLMKTTMGRRIALKMQSLSQRRVFGRVLLMIIPILGGIFSLHLFRCDFVRINEEKLKYNTSDNLILYVATMVTLYCVAMADLLDTACHFALSYFFLLSSTMIKPKIVLVEKFSFICAIVSTACAIIGELTSFISSIQRQDQINKYKTE